MKALLVQPPFAQLNSPYPAVHYLEAFLRGRGIEARSVDHSIELYRSIFSREGIAPAFEAARAKLESARPAAPPDAATIAELERYLSYEHLYLEWIDGLVDFLGGGDPSFAHRLAQAAELPQGMRASSFLAARGLRISEAEAPLLATAMLSDLGDLVAYALDPSFATVRYGERIASSAASFAPIRDALDASPLLGSAYDEILAAEWARQGRAPELLLVSIPFPGCLLGALACARSARAAFGTRTRVVFGGGYVSTELRELRDPGIFDFCDYLSFDSAYGSLASIIEVEAGADRGLLYKAMYRGADGRVVAAGFDDEGCPDRAGAPIGPSRSTPCADGARFRAEDQAAIRSVAPDYASADFGRYLRAADSENPMHRLWSDSVWLKYRLAQGCYWRRCAFCDTGLEYVSRYVPAELGPLMDAASAASERSGIRGIHFVDEAMPMKELLAFACANRARAREKGKAFHFWGNVRFDSSWTEDRCEFLAASGLIAVSGGIEIATEAGLEMTDKGFDLRGLVTTLVAMRRAGLLVHAYLIYGFPGQSRRDIVDSAEACRQLFASGLVDSAFWHRFVLTRHSRMYRERLAGKRAGLEAIERSWDFANNDLGFAGEEAFDEFDAPLAAALDLWMAGEALERPAERTLAEAGLPRVGRCAIGRELVESLVAEAERELENSRAARSGQAHWIAGAPVTSGEGDEERVTWVYRGEHKYITVRDNRSGLIAKTLRDLAGKPAGRPYQEVEGELDLGRMEIAELRSSGLVVA
jgi:radical SAM superfamily enzyme YgiQ (UPF0313 family)